MDRYLRKKTKNPLLDMR